MKKQGNILLILIMIVGDIYYILTNVSNGNTERLATFLILFPILLVPKLIELFLHKELKVEYKLIYYLFVFLAQFLGSVVNLYSKIGWYDDFTHYLSGILTTYLASILYHTLTKSKNVFLKVTYLLGFVFMIASLWEFFEYGMDTLTGSNLQHGIETGVSDTMNDMIAAFLGFITYLVLSGLKIDKEKPL